MYHFRISDNVFLISHFHLPGSCEQMEMPIDFLACIFFLKEGGLLQLKFNIVSSLSFKFFYVGLSASR